jgi:hypothetical protein
MLPEYTPEELAAGLDRVADKILAQGGVRATHRCGGHSTACLSTLVLGRWR